VLNNTKFSTKDYAQLIGRIQSEIIKSKSLNEALGSFINILDDKLNKYEKNNSMILLIYAIINSDPMLKLFLPLDPYFIHSRD